MVLVVLRSSRALRAFVLTTWAASLLAWPYITFRIIVDGIDPPDPFLPGVSGLSFIRAGAIAFGAFCVSMFLYLWLWGRFDRGIVFEGSSGYREP